MKKIILGFLAIIFTAGSVFSQTKRVTTKKVHK